LGSLVVSRIGDTAAPVKAKEAWPEKPLLREILASIDAAWRKGGSAVWSEQPNSGARYAVRILDVKWRLKSAIARDIIHQWLINGVLAVEVRDTKTHTRGLKVVGSID
jgi:hypothetical protein